MAKPLIKSILVPALLSLLVLSGCSAVFKAGVSGTVRDFESTSNPKAGIANMDVYAYTSESARDTDLSGWQAGTTAIGSSSSYVGRTTTGADGTFTINRLVWETFSPAFGKTADYRDLFMIFHQTDFGLHTNSKPITVISDSTNVNAVNEEFSKVNQLTDLQLTINNVAGGALGQAVSVKVTVPQGAGVDAKVYQTLVDSAGTLTVSHPKSMAVPPQATIELTLNGSTWLQCDKDGGFTASATSATLSESPTLVPLYMKNTELDFPSINGQVRINYLIADDTKAYSDDDDLRVWLAYRNGDGKLVLYNDTNAEQISQSTGDTANGGIFQHGLFDNLGNGMTWNDTNYTMKYATILVTVVIDANENGILDATDRYMQIQIRSDRALHTIGAMTLANTTAVLAGDLP